MEQQVLYIEIWNNRFFILKYGTASWPADLIGHAVDWLLFSVGILISSTMINAEFTSLKLPAVLRMPKTIQHKNFFNTKV